MITKRTKIFLAVLVVVALLAHAYLYWWGNTEDHGVLDAIPVVQNVSESLSNTVRPKPQAPAPAVTPDADGPAVAYRIYENTEFGFSFSYPDTWQPSLTKNEDGATVCFVPSEGVGGCRVTVSLAKESVNVSLEKTIAALAAEYRAGRISNGTRRIGGEAAGTLSVSGYPAGQENSTRAAVFVHDTQVYSIEAAAGQEAVFDRVVSSFRFQD